MHDKKKHDFSLDKYLCCDEEKIWCTEPIMQVNRIPLRRKRLSSKSCYQKCCISRETIPSSSSQKVLAETSRTKDEATNPFPSRSTQSESHLRDESSCCGTSVPGKSTVSQSKPDKYENSSKTEESFKLEFRHRIEDSQVASILERQQRLADQMLKMARTDEKEMETDQRRSKGIGSQYKYSRCDQNNTSSSICRKKKTTSDDSDRRSRSPLVKPPSDSSQVNNKTTCVSEAEQTSGSSFISQRDFSSSREISDEFWRRYYVPFCQSSEEDFHFKRKVHENSGKPLEQSIDTKRGTQSGHRNVGAKTHKQCRDVSDHRNEETRETCSTQNLTGEDIAIDTKQQRGQSRNSSCQITEESLD